MGTEVNSEYHKGGLCPYAQGALFCSEGYCDGCEIYKKWKEGKDKVG